jgi:NTP pyrophosphatase (non-canonical NTP hydrolase)
MTANFLNEYQSFVEHVTSPESNDLQTFMDRLLRLSLNSEPVAGTNETQQGPKINVPLLLTAGMGLGSEAGEFQEIIKKIFFQGKPLTDDNVFHMKRELGDIMWYWINACRALNLDPYSVIEENVTKLKSRYPEFEFSAERSENRKAGDL